jgi:hypothetical protein
MWHRSHACSTHRRPPLGVMSGYGSALRRREMQEPNGRFFPHRVELGSENRLRKHSRGLMATVDRSLPSNLLEAHTETVIGEGSSYGRSREHRHSFHCFA